MIMSAWIFIGEQAVDTANGGARERKKDRKYVQQNSADLRPIK